MVAASSDRGVRKLWGEREKERGVKREAERHKMTGGRERVGENEREKTALAEGSFTMVCKAKLTPSQHVIWKKRSQGCSEASRSANTIKAFL